MGEKLDPNTDRVALISAVFPSVYESIDQVCVHHVDKRNIIECELLDKVLEKFLMTLTGRLFSAFPEGLNSPIQIRRSYQQN